MSYIPGEMDSMWECQVYHMLERVVHNVVAATDALVSDVLLYKECQVNPMLERVFHNVVAATDISASDILLYKGYHPNPLG